MILLKDIKKVLLPLIVILHVYASLDFIYGRYVERNDDKIEQIKTSLNYNDKVLDFEMFTLLFKHEKLEESNELDLSKTHRVLHMNSVVKVNLDHLKTVSSSYGFELLKALYLNEFSIYKSFNS